MKMSLPRRLYYSLSPKLRLYVRRMYYLPGDVLHKLFRRKSIVPPKGLIFTGSGDYLAVGNKFLEYFIQYAGLMPHHRVLDVGCGIGRMAVPLTGYLHPEAQYGGFDIVRQGIRWCQKNITVAYPNFHFKYVDVTNDLYRLSGRDARQFSFPYTNSEYDVALVISVFTHMVHKEVENYLVEIHRTLHQHGVLFATFFILNDISRSKMKERSFRFDYADENCYLMDPEVKSANVAYDESIIEDLIYRTGFTIRHRLYGTWSGRSESTLDFQDILVLEKLR